MEASPLTKAHDHARAASVATQTSDTTVAINEHTLAAGEFSNAASVTSSVEALRTLKLLEDHHRRLSELLKFPNEQGSQQSIPEEDEDIVEDEKQAGEGAEAGHGTTKSDKKARAGDAPAGPAAVGLAKPVPTLTQQRRYPGRDLSSSIASNLASARGIKSKYRGQPLTPSVSNEQAPGNLEVHPRREGSAKSGDGRKPSWIPPAPLPTVKSEATKLEEGSQNSSASPPDEGFSRFYSTFGSIINRLSAPLAFAGLPLIAEEAGPEPAPVEPAPQQHKKARVRPPPMSVSTEPDIGKHFSRATLRALAKDGHGPQDSFYVVPTTGHTASYANILSYDQKERRRLAASIHSGGSDDASGLGGNGDEVDDDDFVDARESQAAPMSPTLRKRAGKTLSERDMHNIIEELRTENGSLKEMLDKLSKRLHAFELNSQSSHLALAQSLRLQRPGSPMSSSGGAGGGGAGSGSKAEMVADEALRKRNHELEEQLSGAMKQMEALEREFLKAQSSLEKYRDRWEKLKAGAKARRELQGASENFEEGK